MLEYNGYYTDPECPKNSLQMISTTPPSVDLSVRRRRDVNSTDISTIFSNETTPMHNITSIPATEIPILGHKGDDVNEDDGDRFFSNLVDASKNVGNDLLGIGGKLIDNVPLEAGDEESWLLGLHQVLLFFLVIGRWLLPRGGISREQLSQLLLVFIGTGADILEFVSETIEDDTERKCEDILRYMIWSVWAWSLLQFTLVLTASTSKKDTVATTTDSTREEFKSRRSWCSCCHGYFANPDVWGMLTTLFLQDLPFLVARCYFIFQLQIQSQMMIFFALKNLLVVFLQVYRLIILWSAKND